MMNMIVIITMIVMNKIYYCKCQKFKRSYFHGFSQYFYF